jgi:hypothetical protein
MTQTIALMNLLESREEETNAVSLPRCMRPGLGWPCFHGGRGGEASCRTSAAKNLNKSKNRLMYVITRAQRSLHQLLHQTQARQGGACEKPLSERTSRR